MVVSDFRQLSTLKEPRQIRGFGVIIRAELAKRLVKGTFGMLLVCLVPC